MSSQTPKPSLPDLFGVYIHWPYCLSKCPYCDFASVAGACKDEAALAARYRDELKNLPRRTITSVFFGGGTPSLMSVDLVRALLEQMAPRLAPDVEITMEANPDAIDAQKMRELKALGVNRLSLGVQSLVADDLKRLGRRHSVQTALKRIEQAQRVFPRVNMDLIYARPGQTAAAWADELRRAIQMGLTHYALYQLTIEENTPFGRQGVCPADDETAREMYVMTDKMMSNAGVPAYEVSNYARAGYECRHNRTYWLGADYAGVGPAACGRLGLKATQNPDSVAEWLCGKTLVTRLTSAERETEKILMGLRLRQGGYPADELNPAGVARAVRNRWARLRQNRVYPTLEGTLMLNQLVLTVLPPEDPARRTKRRG